MKRAVVMGSTLASFCVEKFGTEAIENLTHEIIYERMNQFVKITDFSFSK